MKTRTPSILLIEDDPVVAKLIEHRLTKNQFRFERRNNGLDGLKAIRELSPDLVLLDVMLPSMNGLELLRQIRSEKQIRDTRVIMLSASMKIKDKEKAFSYEAMDYVEKPFQTDELIIRINKALAPVK
ncbi:response regulator [Rhodohalobacter mucosus]|uniref:Response regulator n=1 Tax=Rhodohalobacter mucosus TaxID=2079485 RepID=A0A316U019_9BACT|nr:response regulator [Rhodohalobacter mucosus]PWN05916.1 response regulator [Rhodohalobacter mucosus]